MARATSKIEAYIGIFPPRPHRTPTVPWGAAGGGGMDLYGDCRLNLHPLWQNEANIHAQRGGGAETFPWE